MDFINKKKLKIIEIQKMVLLDLHHNNHSKVTKFLF